VYIYLSNQSNDYVYWDNFQVGITQGNIAEENHYYAYGLKIATLSSKKLGDVYEGKLKNNYLYNGKELLDEDADLGWLDYGFRSYDPQIGRFPQLDPLTDSYPFLTPYQYASNDPITNIDIDGLEGGPAVGGIVGAAAGAVDAASVKVMEEVFVKATHRVAARGVAKGVKLSSAAKMGVAISGANLINNTFVTRPNVSNYTKNIITANTKPVNCHGCYQQGFNEYKGGSGGNAWYREGWMDGSSYGHQPGGIVLKGEEGGYSDGSNTHADNKEVMEGANELVSLLGGGSGPERGLARKIFDRKSPLTERIAAYFELIHESTEAAERVKTILKKFLNKNEKTQSLGNKQNLQKPPSVTRVVKQANWSPGSMKDVYFWDEGIDSNKVFYIKPSKNLSLPDTNIKIIYPNHRNH
jgi:RHS repeat-associated protein